MSRAILAGLAACGVACVLARPDDERRPLTTGARVWAVGPAAGAQAGGTRPVVWWRGEGRAEAVIDFCLDRACTQVVETVRAQRAAVRPGRALPRATVFWRVRATTWQGEGSVSPTWWFRVPAGARETGVAWRRRGPGDVDGDGRDDILDARGQVRSGPAAGARLMQRALDQAPVVDGGDLNGDGYPELLRVEGSTLEVYSTPLREGVQRSVASLDLDAVDDRVVPGDFDADGYGDLAVADVHYDHDRGSVRVFHGGPDGVDFSAPSALPPASARGAGVTVWSSEGRLDRPGDWLIVAARSRNEVTRWEEAPRGVWRAVSTQVATRALAGDGLARDVTGDGIPDLIRLVEGDDAFSRCVEVVTGERQVTLSLPCATAHELSQSTTTLLDVADLNGDGVGDIVMTASRYYEARRGFYWALGGDAETLNSPFVLVLSPDTTVRSFGAFVTGDTNADGYDDVVAFGYIYERMSRTWVFRGAPGGISRRWEAVAGL